METFAIASVVLGCVAVFFWLSLWIILEEARRLKASNNILAWCLDDEIKEKEHLESRIERLQRWNNRYKAKLHRRENRIKNLVSKIEKTWL